MQKVLKRAGLDPRLVLERVYQEIVGVSSELESLAAAERIFE